VDILRQVWVQQYYQDQGEVRWRDHQNVPPSALMIASPYDLEVRYSEKRGHHWRGYKVHLTETCDTDAPHVITHVETTLATDQDVTAVDTIHQGLADKALLPEVHLVDGAYVSSDELVASQHDYHVTLTGPMRQDQSWQAHDDQGVDISQFRIHWDQEMVTCPTGHQSRYWKPATGPRGKPTIQVLFDKKTCAGCSVRTRCTRSKAGPRELTLHPQAQHLARQIARARQHTDAFKELYKNRAGVEGTISQAVFACGMRRTRYRGVMKTHLQHLATAAAINLQRFVGWLWDVPRSITCKSPFARLALST
jgi:transposase